MDFHPVLGCRECASGGIGRQHLLFLQQKRGFILDGLAALVDRDAIQAGPVVVGAVEGIHFLQVEAEDVCQTWIIVISSLLWKLLFSSAPLPSLRFFSLSIRRAGGREGARYMTSFAHTQEATTAGTCTSVCNGRHVEI